MRKAFIDGQNLYLGTKTAGWSIDYKRLRIYLKDKYKVGVAYYFMGFKMTSEKRLYDSIIDAGFVLVFREHDQKLLTKKKGNIDTDLVFYVMKELCEDPVNFEVLIISGDGDYIKMVEWLIQKGRFVIILFPNRTYASSLYKRLRSKYYDFLDSKNIKEKLEYK